MSNTQNRTINRLCLLEMWERFSYYGMRSLLVLYMVKIIGFEDGKAYVIYGLFASICFFIPVVGGYIADRFLGYKHLVMTGAFLMCIGQLTLALATITESTLYIGIAFIAIGTGFFKSNISTMLGSVFDKSSSCNRDNGFRKFYIAINFGSFIASISCGAIAQIYGWNYAFGFAAVGMLLGLILLISSRNILKDIGNPQHVSNEKLKLYVPMSYLVGGLFTAITVGMFYYADQSIKIISLLGVAVIAHLMYLTTTFKANERRGIYLILAMLLFFMTMFAIEMHIGSFINIFTDKHVNKTLFGITIPTASLQSINPLTIILLGSSLSYLMRKVKAKYTLMIFGAGFFMALISFLTLYIACSYFNQDYQVSIFFLITAMVFLALSEVMMAPIMQSLVTFIAPQKIRGYMMGFMTMSLSYSNILGGIILKNLLNIEKSNTEVTGEISLATYQSCFFKVTIAFAILSLFYIILYKSLTRIYRSYGK